MSMLQSRLAQTPAPPHDVNILDALSIDHGPAELIGRFVLAADEAAHSAGLSVCVAPLEALVEANRANISAWRPMLPVLDPELAGFEQADGFCILARNSRGEVVATNACRRLGLGPVSLAEELESLRFFYKEPQLQKQPNERCVVTAVAAGEITGEIVYFGGSWCHPDYRGRALSGIVTRLGKAFALARWPMRHGVGLMLESVYKRGFAQHLGFTSIDWSVSFKNTREGDKVFGLLRTDPDALIADLAMYYTTNLSHNDGIALADRRAQQP